MFIVQRLGKTIPVDDGSTLFEENAKIWINKLFDRTLFPDNMPIDDAMTIICAEQNIDTNAKIDAKIELKKFICDISIIRLANRSKAITLGDFRGSRVCRFYAEEDLPLSNDSLLLIVAIMGQMGNGVLCIKPGPMEKTGLALSPCEHFVYAQLQMQHSGLQKNAHWLAFDLGTQTSLSPGNQDSPRLATKTSRRCVHLGFTGNW